MKNHIPALSRKDRREMLKTFTKLLEIGLDIKDVRTIVKTAQFMAFTNDYTYPNALNFIVAKREVRLSLEKNRKKWTRRVLKSIRLIGFLKSWVSKKK